MIKAFVASLLAALSLSCASCTAPVLPAPRVLGKITVTIDPKVRPTRATVKLAHEVTIVLPAAHPDGYVWQIAQHNPDTLQQLSEIVVPADTGGASTVSFITRRTGRTRLLFTLVPAAAEAAVVPADVQEVQVTIE